MGIQSAVNLGCACFLFPQTVSHKYIANLISVLKLVKSGIGEQASLLSISPMNLKEWQEYKVIQNKVQQGKTTFIAMIANEEFLTKEICYARIQGKELVALKSKVRKLLSGLGIPLPRSDIGGFHYWYYAIEAKVTVYMQSRPPTPSTTPRSSQVSLDTNNVNKSLVEQSHSHSNSRIRLPQLAALHRHYEPVGVLESQTYSDLEAGFQYTLSEKAAHYENMVAILSSSCGELLGECERGMSVVIKWFESVNSDRLYARLFRRKSKDLERQKLFDELAEAITSIHSKIDRFRATKRLEVLEPHIKWFHSMDNQRQPSYRLIFMSFFYQFHLVEFASSLHSLMEDLQQNDSTHPTPTWTIPSFLEFGHWLAKGGEKTNQASKEDLASENQDPEDIPHIPDRDNEQKLLVQPRNPDAGPPTNIGHLAGRVLVSFFKLLGRPDVFFAVKAGIVTVLVAMPAYFKSTAGWFYFNRGIWAVIMTALTIAQFTADTVFGFVCRIVGTFLGALLGMVIWYIGSGSGMGNAYGLLACLAVCIPFMMFIRVNFVRPLVSLIQVYLTPMPAIIFCITATLIIGYSWHDVPPILHLT
jgi:Putative ER transporter, 6TM, N-terminal/Fusaric acid resistance protein-like